MNEWMNEWMNTKLNYQYNDWHNEKKKRLTRNIGEINDISEVSWIIEVWNSAENVNVSTLIFHNLIRLNLES